MQLSEGRGRRLIQQSRWVQKAVEIEPLLNGVGSIIAIKKIGREVYHRSLLPSQQPASKLTELPFRRCRTAQQTITGSPQWSEKKCQISIFTRSRCLSDRVGESVHARCLHEEFIANGFAGGATIERVHPPSHKQLKLSNKMCPLQ